MATIRYNTQALGVLFLLASSWSPLTSAISVDICASINTGTTSKNTSIYQSNGLCHDWCLDDYAYAITQNNACWCSNYAPAKSDRESTSSCDTSCPGYPSEDCGGDGLYGYLSLGNVQPSGTRGASSTATSDAQSTAVIKVTETVQNTVTVVSSETAASTTDESSSSTDSSTTADAQSSAIQTVTADGTVKTVYIGPTGSANAANDNSTVSSKGSGLSTGAVAGIVVGIIAAVIAGAGVALFLWFRRRKQRNEQQGFQDDPSIRDSSSASRPEKSTAGVSPVSPSAAAKRNSTLQVDPRMDPFKQGLYVRNGSHESINTLRDDHDYSRRIQAPKVLRATNPDPDT